MIPGVILEHLTNLRPGAEFTGSPPRVKSSDGGLFFVKVGSASEAEQYAGEAESLKAIDAAAPGLAPHVYVSGEDEDGRPYFVSDYLDFGPLSDKAGTELAKRLALELHQYTSEHGFGFHVPTYCGATRMKNGWYSTWQECYSEMIKDLLGMLKSKGGRYSGLCSKGDKIVTSVIPKLLGSIHIEPALCHGDLWSGNAGSQRSTGLPVVFDPSSYFGHSELDLAIARIFGGFSSSFFETYHKYLPKTEPVDQYGLRAELYEMFHYLNHTVLFGGGYAGSAERKMDVLLKALPSI
ncbi:fructosamine kinase PKL/CAK/FruK [Cylindrobasidium torrendii FP15055 ss-10]|uniref:protein-ribulosamine 3-kinase n=1 Tax=Cylindrobasidium torrendii FP15055 ss-10 TaxID=1314674 RepID=A0A0D7BG35_9AGAR|nr:fructosamine kinase PKL/CAK/FruK [Cylindrobasidium torrendii FP15055 ss-10]